MNKFNVGDKVRNKIKDIEFIVDSIHEDIDGYGYIYESKDGKIGAYEDTLEIVAREFQKKQLECTVAITDEGTKISDIDLKTTFLKADIFDTLRQIEINERSIKVLVQKKNELLSQLAELEVENEI